MYDYHLNLFRPYQHDCRNEMSVTRAFIISCKKSVRGLALLQKVMQKAGIGVPLTESEFTLELEVPAGTIQARKESRSKAVLCIAPNDTVVRDGVLSALYTSAPGILHKLSDHVPCDCEDPDLDKFKKRLLEIFPHVHDALAHQDESEASSLMNAAYWDTWRLLYSGARVDALVQNSDFACLIESKIWGSVYEIQARNHAHRSFGTADVPIHGISWQSIHDIAKAFDDPICADLAQYLSEFPQLVRWNGFDLQDIEAFAMNAEKLESEESLKNRLRSRYWQCMEDLCERYNYKVSARRGEDWDFTPHGRALLGNTGIGYWGSGALTAKWCVGYHAWEMDTLMAKPDLIDKGEIACHKLARFLSSCALSHGLEVEMRAVQRFQFVNAQDGAWYDGSFCAVSQNSEFANSLKQIFKKEWDILVNFHRRRGQDLSSAEALEIKREIFGMRYPGEDGSKETMATGHERWNLFAALDVFIHIDPKVFGKVTAKERQLSELDKIVNGLALFAETICG